MDAKGKGIPLGKSGEMLVPPQAKQRKATVQRLPGLMDTAMTAPQWPQVKSVLPFPSRTGADEP
jgi:hypothetical protein